MVFRTSLVFGTLVVTAHAAVAAPGGAHRARMSADLQDHLNVGSQTIEVIVDGDAASIDALAARYNLRVSKRIESGAVLTVNAGQLAAIQQDEAVDHLSGNVRIQSSDAVTAESIGAAIKEERRDATTIRLFVTSSGWRSVPVAWKRAG